ncbi:ubiquitin carboxyl-terminal hydrolase 30 homolog [Eurytemora carolleeae]|uniref:ubiquitin carboxyl-terminal hydrolase 30 homolog n=1 Tax=Eurytemora carolleeae TaxID=1294199 RepID=UPI000C77D691|nr:ubiquitin carboxyl-terminal hydrolase 30 homolog [Eurytemora carolleeae]|eukprot:XP_023340426.1 ubiquitin carboxyl-terminal hydrolase 30 homolog [Eurytemora affinis]
MCKILAVLNNLDSGEHSNPYNPSLVLHALRAHGWIINREEQDAHEMLNVLMTTLEEEMKEKSSRSKPSHASLLDISNLGVSDEEEEEDKDDSRVFHRGMSCPPERASRERLLPRPSQSISRDTSPVTESRELPGRRHRRSSSGVFNKFGELIPASLDPILANKGEISPLTGLLTNKLSNNAGKSSSPVKYSSFNNITLNLPTQVFGFVTLETLLQMFISKESVEGESKEQNLIKQLTFGKLPECLCLHIQRTGFGGGQPFKRHEFVEFPPVLSMEKYVYSTQLIKQNSINNLKARGAVVDLGLTSSGGLGSLYSLRAVIVHSGGIDSGHYITYRKGPIGSKTENKWFYTSDSLVKQVKYSEVSRSSAYMLFYERENK